jgi:hypothetical protein
MYSSQSKKDIETRKSSPTSYLLGGEIKKEIKKEANFTKYNEFFIDAGLFFLQNPKD